MGTSMIQALFAAALWGATDAFAGLSARRATPLLSAVWLHVTSIVVLLPVILWTGGLLTISMQDALYGAAAGIVAAIGDVLFGRALSKSSMTVGIPLANVIAASIPAAVAVVQGEHVTSLAGIGVAGALVASALAVAPSNGKLAGVGAGYAVVAGICFGAMYGLLSQVHAAGSLTVIFVMRCAGMLALVPGLVRTHVRWSVPMGIPGAMPGILSGFASIGANWLFVLAMSSGSRVAASVVAIALSAPAGMLIANLSSRERLTAMQGAAASCAVLAITLLAIPAAIL